MLAGIRTLELRKVYDSLSPVGAGGFAFTAPGAKGKTRQPKPQIVALEGISLDIAPGEIFRLLGPNGAGKSTTVGVLTTRIRPTSGQAFIGEHDVWLNQVAVKRLIGVVAQRPNLDFSLTAREILAFHGAYFGLSSHERAKRAKVLLERFKLTDRADQLVRGFSGGMMQQLSIARHDARSAGSLPRRAKRRSRSADALAFVGDRPRVQPERQNRSAHHAQHGRSRRALPAPGHH